MSTTGGDGFGSRAAILLATTGGDGFGSCAAILLARFCWLRHGAETVEAKGLKQQLSWPPSTQWRDLNGRAEAVCD